MKKLFIYLSIVLLGCEPSIKKTKDIGQYNGLKINVVEIDSCEYLMFCDDIRTSTHKGNCKYCKSKTK